MVGIVAFEDGILSVGHLDYSAATRSSFESSSGMITGGQLYLLRVQDMYMTPRSLSLQVFMQYMFPHRQAHQSAQHTNPQQGQENPSQRIHIDIPNDRPQSHG